MTKCLQESRMREICTSGSTRGSDGEGIAPAIQPPVTLYSTERLWRWLTLSFVLPFGLLLASPSATAEIHTLTEHVRDPAFEDITFFLRMPSAWDGEGPERDAFGRKVPTVRGVLAVCSYSADPEAVRRNVEPKGRFKHFHEWADRNRLAVMTWTNFRGYTIRESGDEMSEERREYFDKAFGARVKEWERGFRRMCRQYGLPEENVLLYGISGGGQMAHRLALQVPERFFAIHIHVNSSYDLPRRGGERMLWMVTTGTLEAGYPEAQRFYRRALDLGYHMIFKAEENLGHADSGAIRKLSLAFFDFCLLFLPDAADPEWEAPPEEWEYFMRYPVYLGDWYNQLVFPAEVGGKRIPPEFLVSLPSRGIAEAWGGDCGMKIEEWSGGVLEWCSAFALPPYAKASFYALPPAPRLPSTLFPLRPRLRRASRATQDKTEGKPGTGN